MVPALAATGRIRPRRLAPEAAQELRAAFAAEQATRRRLRETVGETDQAVLRARGAGASYHAIARLLVPGGTNDTLTKRRRMATLLRQRLHKRRRVSTAHAIQPGTATNGFSPTVAGAILGEATKLPEEEAMRLAKRITTTTEEFSDEQPAEAAAAPLAGVEDVEDDDTDGEEAEADDEPEEQPQPRRRRR